MGKLLERLKSQRGETLVELMVSIVIFLLLLGTMAGAISFASSAQQKAQALRDNAAALQQSVRHTSPSGTETRRDLHFYVTNYKQTQLGAAPVCTIPVNQQTIAAEGTSGTTDFAVFGAARTPADGGEGSGG